MMPPACRELKAVVGNGAPEPPAVGEGRRRPAAVPRNEEITVGGIDVANAMTFRDGLPETPFTEDEGLDPHQRGVVTCGFHDPLAGHRRCLVRFIPAGAAQEWARAAFVGVDSFELRPAG
jgi:hypothetical protein